MVRGIGRLVGVVVCVMSLAVAASPASASGSATPVARTCRFFTVADARKLFGSTVSRVASSKGSCLYSAPAATQPTEPSSAPVLGVMVQAWLGAKPKTFTVKPTPDAQRVRVGSTWGWYLTPPTPTGPNAVQSIGILTFYDRGYQFHVAVSGTTNDQASSAKVGTVVLQHL